VDLARELVVVHGVERRDAAERLGDATHAHGGMLRVSHPRPP
jgi:hypothetical protein